MLWIHSWADRLARHADYPSVAMEPCSSPWLAAHCPSRAVKYKSTSIAPARPSSTVPNTLPLFILVY